MHTGQLITQLRKGAGLTQQQLADLLNISKAAIGQLETRENCSVAKLLKVANVCGYQGKIEFIKAETPISITL